MRVTGIYRSGMLLLVGLLLLTPQAMYAHAILLRSTPAAHSTVHGPHLDVQLKFNSRVDGKRSKLVLNAGDGRELPLSQLAEPDAATLVTAADGLTRGHYVLHWIVLASDGHITRGEIPFEVE